MKKYSKIIKGIMFIAIGLCFFNVKLYNIQSIAYVDGVADGMVYAWIPSQFAGYFNEFFKQSGINLILALLFIGIGVLELIETKGGKK